MTNLFSKFATAIILGLLGLFLLFFAISTGQNTFFIFGSVSILLISIVSGLNSSEIINNQTSKIASFVLIVICLGLTFSNYKSIKDPLDFAKERDFRYQYVIQRLKDLREVQLGYKNHYGKYTGDLDSLVQFVKNDSLNIVKAIGAVPDTLTEAQALEQGLISRDTVRVPASEYIFNEKYISERKIGKLIIDSLPYVPFTSERFNLQVGHVSRGKISVQVFQIEDGKPYDPFKVMQVGSLSDVSTAGNWGE